MASFFISHSSEDNAAAARLRDWLDAAGFQALFLDFDPGRGIPPGRRWEEEVYSQLQRADIVVFLGTAAALRSKWCHAELVLARSLRKRILPLLLERGAAHPLVADTQWIDVSADGDVAFQRLGAVVRDLGVDPLDTLEWDQRIGPYPGLLPFDERRAGVFFGRDEEIRSIRELVLRPHATDLQRLLLVVGPSGSGKSSLVRAGVLPRLARGGERCVVVPAFTAERDPLEKLARSLANAFAQLEREVGWQACRERLAGADGALVGLARDLLDAAGWSTDGCVVVTVDQAEQLVTQCAAAERVELLNLLVAALAGPAPLCVLATVRTEYLAELAAGTALEGHAATTIPVSRLSASRLAQVIAEPAARAGVAFDAALVERIAAETRAGLASGGDPLPLLAFTLRRLYEGRAEPTRITERDYEHVGGVVGALRAEADRVLEQLERNGKADVVVPALLELVHAEFDREPTARAVPRERFVGPRSDVIDAFVEARLLTTDETNPVVSVAHEALLREWPVLVRAIEDARDDLQARARLERDAREWARVGRDSRYLATDVRLEAARRAVGKAGDGEAALAGLEREFFEASVAHEEQRRRAARRRVQLTIGGLAVALVLIGAGGLLAFWQSRVAAGERDAARSRELALQAIGQLSVDPAESIRLAVQAAGEKRTVEAEQALRAALSASYDGAVLRGHQGAVRSAAFDGTGTRVVTASSDGTARVWDAGTGRSLQTLRGHRFGEIDSAALDAAARRVVTVGGDGTVRVWDAATGRELDQVSEGSVLRVTFEEEAGGFILVDSLGDATVWDPVTNSSPARFDVSHRLRARVISQPFQDAGTPIVAVDDRGTAYIWEDASAQSRVPLRGHRGRIGSAEFDQSGQRLVTTATEDRNAMIWDAATGRSLLVLRGHTDVVNSARFDTVGKRILTASADKTARVWDAETGRTIATLRGHTDGVLDAVFDAQGRRVLTASADGTARVWQVPTGSSLVVLHGEASPFAGADFDLQGERFVASNSDGTLRVREAATGRSLVALRNSARYVGAAFDPGGRRVVALRGNSAAVWDVATGKMSVRLDGHTRRVDSAVFDRDGERILTVSADEDAARVWDAASGESLSILDARQATQENWAYPLYDLRAVFDPEGKRVLTIREGTAHIWDATSGRSLALLRGGAASLAGAFAPDGRRVVTAGDDGTVRIWDAAGGQLLQALSGQRDEAAHMAFDPAGKLLVTMGSGRARVWDVAAGRSLTVFRGDGGPVEDASFTADGKRIITIHKDGGVRIHACRPCGSIDDLLAEARRAARYAPADDLTVAHLGLDRKGSVVLVHACRPCGPDHVSAEGRRQASFDDVKEVLDERLGSGEHNSSVRVYACRPCATTDRGAPSAVILELLREVLVEHFGIRESEITADTSFAADLDADELDRIELVMLVEDEFGIHITDEEWAKIKTVGQAIELIAART